MSFGLNLARVNWDRLHEAKSGPREMGRGGDRVSAAMRKGANRRSRLAAVLSLEHVADVALANRLRVYNSIINRLLEVDTYNSENAMGDLQAVWHQDREQIYHGASLSLPTLIRLHDQLQEEGVITAEVRDHLETISLDQRIRSDELRRRVQHEVDRVFAHEEAERRDLSRGTDQTQPTSLSESHQAAVRVVCSPDFQEKARNRLARFARSMPRYDRDSMIDDVLQDLVLQICQKSAFDWSKVAPDNMPYYLMQVVMNRMARSIRNVNRRKEFECEAAHEFARSLSDSSPHNVGRELLDSRLAEALIDYVDGNIPNIDGKYFGERVSQDRARFLGELVKSKVTTIHYISDFMPRLLYESWGREFRSKYAAACELMTQAQNGDLEFNLDELMRIARQRNGSNEYPDIASQLKEISKLIDLLTRTACRAIIRLKKDLDLD